MKSTTDRIVALRVLLEFQRELFIAYVGIKKAVYSVHLKAVWKIMLICGFPAKIIYLMADISFWIQITLSEKEVFQAFAVVS